MTRKRPMTRNFNTTKRIASSLIPGIHKKVNSIFNDLRPQCTGVEKFFFLSGNLDQGLEIFCEICNVTITKLTKQTINA